ncbi:hypothetical protein NPIL_103671 [Nephila pilipes]|uniref:Uncharacterized protein n=1 Tax=Nephila pilipes TaxID=299642 RepID=A0A8X6PZX2_NEPPI|nr:hypothetical protein NPIL_103671 [Nephila pilipes]
MMDKSAQRHARNNPPLHTGCLSYVICNSMFEHSRPSFYFSSQKLVSSEYLYSRVPMQRTVPPEEGIFDPTMLCDSESSPMLLLQVCRTRRESFCMVVSIFVGKRIVLEVTHKSIG